MISTNKFKIFFPIIILVITEIFLVTKISSDLHKKNMYKEAVKNAVNTVHHYQEVRAYYNENIVKKITQSTQLRVDSEHKNSPDTIPLPATLIHDLSERISKKINGIEVKLYSDYPFPNRLKRELDNFQRSSIEHFKISKEREPLILHQETEGSHLIRVAVADEMNAVSCVNCHNTRSDSPKKDWKLGDVRGILEVSVPLEAQGNNVNAITRYINLTILIASGILLILIYFVIFYFTNVEKSQKRQLEEEQSKLKQALISFDKNVIASHSDAYGNITYASHALCDISGYTQEELVGKPHSVLRHPDMPKAFFKDLWKTIKAGKVWVGEVKNKKKGGAHYWVRTTITPEYDHDNNIIAYSSIRQDITAHKAKEEFFSNMSHELRTPLTAILGFVNILSKEISNKEHQEYLGYIGSNSHQLLELINDILDLAKIQHGEFTIEPHEFNPYSELSVYTHHFDGILSNKHLLFKTDISPDLVGTFKGDWLRISQIILNLISNAIKFTPEHGNISLKVDYLKGAFVIVVSDSGIGMSHEVQDQIFKPFTQADGSTTRRYGGTGLGLSITQKLIEMMKGHIELKSTENKGTTFTVVIPIEKVSDDILEEDKAIVELGDKVLFSGKVLVAEDNKTNQLLVRLILEDMGLKCDIVNDGQEALDMYDPTVHRLILMDENMPNMNGVKAMHHIREKHKDACGPIIALTANVMKGDKENFIKEGMDGYLEKPIDEEKLYKTLKTFLNTKD